MRFIKYASVAIVIIFSLGLSSCSSYRAQVMSTDYEKIGEMRFQQIIDALNSKDNDALKSLFAPNALKQADDIDGGIEYLMEFYQGKIRSKDVAREILGSNESGEKTSELKCFYTVTTGTDTYIVFFIDKLVDTEHPDNVGLYMLQIIKESDREEQFDWGGEKTICAGIYRPPEAATENASAENG